jgi:hypothetical protein
MLAKLLGATDGRSNVASSLHWHRAQPDLPMWRRPGARVRITTRRQPALLRHRAAGPAASAAPSQAVPRPPARAPPADQLWS